MGRLLDFEEAYARRQRLVFVDGCLGALDDAAMAIAIEYEELCRADVRQAIAGFVEFTTKMRDVNPCVAAGGSDAILGGPNHTWISCLLNSLGDTYTDLPEDLKRVALEEVVVNYLDMRNSRQATDHVELIQVPALAGDIVINRPEYFPDHALQAYTAAVEANDGGLVTSTTYENMAIDLDRLPSPFWAARAVARLGRSHSAVAARFYLEHRTLMRDTLRALAGIIDVHARRFPQGLIPEARIEDKLTRYDPRLVRELRQNIEAKTWIEMVK